MATGIARGAFQRGRRIAFGDGKQILWDHNSELIFRDNPNIARPGQESGGGLEWIEFYKGHRLYNRQDYKNDRWIWSKDFHATPGEIFMSAEEKAYWPKDISGCVIIEPNIPNPLYKAGAINKDWPLARYQEIANRLYRLGYDVRQFQYPGMKHCLINAKPLPSKNFRQALGAIKKAKIVICCEGGLHHGAAAMGTPAVVLFGGFIPVSVTGYETHYNIAVGEPCGKYVPCAHCKEAMASITVDQVWEGVEKMLGNTDARTSVSAA